MENNGGELFIFLVGVEMETEGIEEWRVMGLKGVFLTVHSYAHFPYRLQSWTSENSMDLCVPLSPPYSSFHKPEL